MSGMIDRLNIVCPFEALIDEYIFLIIFIMMVDIARGKL